MSVDATEAARTAFLELLNTSNRRRLRALAVILVRLQRFGDGSRTGKLAGLRLGHKPSIESDSVFSARRHPGLTAS